MNLSGIKNELFSEIKPVWAYGLNWHKIRNELTINIFDLTQNIYNFARPKFRYKVFMFN